MKVPCAIEGLDRAREFVLASCRDQEIPSRIAVRFAVVTDEHLSNLILHDESLGPGDEVEIAVAREDEAARLTIRDTGMPFDPSAALATADASAGCGVQIICGMADRLAYRSDDAGNRLDLWIGEMPHPVRGLTIARART